MSEEWDEVIAAWRRRVEQLDALALGAGSAGVTPDAAEGVGEGVEEVPDPPAVALTATQRAALAELHALSQDTEERLAERQAAISAELAELAARRRAARGYATDGQS